MCSQNSQYLVSFPVRAFSLLGNSAPLTLLLPSPAPSHAERHALMMPGTLLPGSMDEDVIHSPVSLCTHTLVVTETSQQRLLFPYFTPHPPPLTYLSQIAHIWMQNLPMFGWSKLSWANTSGNLLWALDNPKCSTHCDSWWLLGKWCYEWRFNLSQYSTPCSSYLWSSHDGQRVDLFSCTAIRLLILHPR